TLRTPPGMANDAGSRPRRDRQGDRRGGNRPETEAALHRRLGGRPRQHAPPPRSRPDLRQADPQDHPTRRLVMQPRDTQGASAMTTVEAPTNAALNTTWKPTPTRSSNAGGGG